MDCLKAATGVDQLRASDKPRFNEALRSPFGQKIAAPAWTNHGVNIARVTRHALSHAGGRETADLKKLPHGIKLIDGTLQIVPGDIKRMLKRLRAGVDAILDAAAGDPSFTAPK